LSKSALHIAANIEDERITLLNLEEDIIRCISSPRALHNPLFYSGLADLLQQKNLDDMLLSKVLVRLVFRLRHNKDLLLMLVSDSSLPWSATHGRLLSKTKMAGEIARYMYIPYPQKDVRKLLYKVVKVKKAEKLSTIRSHNEYLVERLTDITAYDITVLWSGKAVGIMAAMIKYHPASYTPEMVENCLELLYNLPEYSIYKFALITTIIDHIPNDMLTENTLIRLYSLADTRDSMYPIYIKLTKLLPYCRTDAIIKSIIEADNKRAMAIFLDLCVNPLESEIRLLLPACSKSTILLYSLSKSPYINWTNNLIALVLSFFTNDPETGNMKYFLENIKDKRVLDAADGVYKKLSETTTIPDVPATNDSCNTAEITGNTNFNIASPVTSSTATIRNVAGIVSGAFVAVDTKNKHWEKKVAEVVQNGLPISKPNISESCSIPLKIKTIQENLDAEYPNFKFVTKLLMGQLFSCLVRKVAICFQPLMLLGDAGIGKTSYAQHLSKLFGLHFKRIDMAGVTANFVLVGNNQGWSSGTPGLIAQTLLSGAAGSANPLFILDEVDKVGGNEGHDVGPALLALLEDQTARTFRDEFFAGVTFDLTQSTFFMTANRIDHMPDALLSRMLIADVPAPTMDEKISIVQRVYTKKLMAQDIFPKFVPTLSEELVVALCGDSLRTMDRDLTLSIANALFRAGITGKDTEIEILTEDLHTNTKKNGIGFR
jgi:ATP-dependent Lon protease